MKNLFRTFEIDLKFKNNKICTYSMYIFSIRALLFRVFTLTPSTNQLYHVNIPVIAPV